MNIYIGKIYGADTDLFQSPKGKCLHYYETNAAENWTENYGIGDNTFGEGEIHGITFYSFGSLYDLETRLPFFYYINMEVIMMCWTLNASLGRKLFKLGIITFSYLYSM